jgi:hypothetical protein
MSSQLFRDKKFLDFSFQPGQVPKIRDEISRRSQKMAAPFSALIDPKLHKGISIYTLCAVQVIIKVQ